MLTGLLLGAGASYDFGLPLVSKVDPEFKKQLTAYFRRVVDCPKEISSEALSILCRQDMNYESMIGYFQLQAYRTRCNNDLPRNYHYISSLFYRAAADIIWTEQRKNEEKLLCPDSAYLNGFKSFLTKNRPLWIFSLNYDSVIECVSSTLQAELCNGLKGNAVLPRRDAIGRKIGELGVETLAESDISSKGLIFPYAETERINLVKLHGSLHMFTFANGKNLMKLAPTMGRPQGFLDALFRFSGVLPKLAASGSG